VSRNNLKDGAQFVRIAYDALRAGERLDNVPKAIVRIIDKDVWQDRICQVTKQRVQYDSFVEFVEDDPPEGLGTTLDQLRSILDGHEEAKTLIEEASTAEHGGDRGNQHTDGKVNNINHGNGGREDDRSRSTGTSLDYTLSRLKRDHEELYENVCNDEMSAHAAAVEAGFRQERTTILLSVESAANTIETKFEGRLAALAGELAGRLDEPQTLAEALAEEVDDLKGLINALRHEGAPDT